jgi:hypothetical protein
MHTAFWFENLKGRDCLECLGVDGKIILKWSLEIYNMAMWPVFNCLSWERIQWWNFMNMLMNPWFQ